MKVCHVAYQTYPTQSGSVMRTNQVMSCCKLNNIEIFVVSAPFQESTIKDNSVEYYEGVKYYRTCSLNIDTGYSNAHSWINKAKKLFSIIHFVKKLNIIVKSERPNVLHAHSTFYAALSSWYVCKKNKIPLIYEVRSAWDRDIHPGKHQKIQGYIFKELEKLSIKLADHVIYISKGLKKHYSIKNSHSIIYNAVDSLGVELSFPQKTVQQLNLGYIGSLVQYEGLEFLINALPFLIEKNIKFHVYIIGIGREKISLEELVSKLELSEYVTFVGKVPPKETLVWYKKFHFIVLPRRNVDVTNLVVGLKPIEAFSRKRLVIASAVGGMTEIIENDKTGVLVMPEAPESLANAIFESYANWSKTVRVVENAFQLYKDQYTLGAMAEKYSTIYKKIL